MEEIEKPVPKAHEVLVKTMATTVTAGDWRMRKADPFPARLYNGLLKPKKVNVLGFEIAGRIEEIGSDVTRFKIGDEIFASCGFLFGGYAEYKCLSENDSIAIKPQNISFEEAAALPIGGMTAINMLTEADVEKADNILIYGASGSVGTYAVQFAKIMNTAVTAVCSGRNIPLVKSLGAARLIDYTKEDFRDCLEKFDIIFDAVGKISRFKCRKLLSKKGKYITVKKGPATILEDIMEMLKKLVEEQKLRVVIDRTYSLKEVPEAHRYVEAGHKVGNVIVKMN